MHHRALGRPSTWGITSFFPKTGGEVFCFLATTVPENHVSCPVRFPGLHQSKISRDCFLQNEVLPIKLPHLRETRLAVRHLGGTHRIMLCAVLWRGTHWEPSEGCFLRIAQGGFRKRMLCTGPTTRESLVHLRTPTTLNVKVCQYPFDCVPWWHWGHRIQPLFFSVPLPK